LVYVGLTSEHRDTTDTYRYFGQLLWQELTFVGVQRYVKMDCLPLVLVLEFVDIRQVLFAKTIPAEVALAIHIVSVLRIVIRPALAIKLHSKILKIVFIGQLRAFDDCLSWITPVDLPSVTLIQDSQRSSITSVFKATNLVVL